jgi:hypothetical protein
MFHLTHSIRAHAVRPYPLSPPSPPPPGKCEKIRLGLFPVIPAEAGIQYFQTFKNRLDPGFHRGDD